MKTAVGFATCLLVALVFAHGQQTPTNPEPGSFEIEPPLLPGNLLSDQPVAGQLPADIAQLLRKLARARESAAGALRLNRMGALSKVEAENRALRVVQLEAELANAQMASAQAEFDQKQARRHRSEIAQAELGTAQLKLTQAKEAAANASSKLKDAQLEAAMLNLERQRKLLALGSGRKSAVSRAEEKFNVLKSQAH